MSAEDPQIVISEDGHTVTAHGKTYKAVRGNGFTFKACNGCAFLGLKGEDQKRMQDLCLATECTEVKDIIGAIYVEVLPCPKS
jgi:hypothetical protein